MRHIYTPPGAAIPSLQARKRVRSRDDGITPLAPSLDTHGPGQLACPRPRPSDAATYSGDETLEASFPETAKLLNGPSGIAGTAEWKAVAQAATQQKAKHLRDQLEDAERCASLRVEAEGVFMDFARQKVDEDTMSKLVALARKANVEGQARRHVPGRRHQRDRETVSSTPRSERPKRQPR